MIKIGSKVKHIGGEEIKRSIFEREPNTIYIVTSEGESAEAPGVSCVRIIPKDSKTWMYQDSLFRKDIFEEIDKKPLLISEFLND